MRRQLIAIVILGLFALVSLGVMASYLTTRNPQLVLQRRLGERFGVRVTGYEGQRFDPATRQRVVSVRLAPERKQDGAVSDEERSYRIALAIDEVLARGHAPDRMPYDVLEIAWAGLAPRRYRRGWLLFRHRMEQRLPPLQQRLAKQLGPGTKLRLVVDGERFGLEVRPGASDRSAAGVDASPAGPRDPADIARAVFRETRHYAFVDVAGLAEQPIRFELGALRRPARR